MDRRSEPRVEINQTAELTILGEPDRKVTALLKNLSGRGLSVLTDCAIPLGTPVRLDVNDSVMLGEICYCASTSEGLICGIQLEQALHSVADLTRLVARLMMEDTGSRPASRDRRSRAESPSRDERGTSVRS